MRIAYLTQSYPPMISGAAQAARQLAESMAQRRHHVLVIAASDRHDPYPTQEGNLTVLRLASVNNPLRIHQRFLLYPRREVMQALRDFQPELLHTHDPLQMGWLGLQYARYADIPIVLTVHQLPGFVSSYLPAFLKRFVDSMLWNYARQLLPKFTAVVTPTRTISTLVAKRTGCQIHSIGYGIDVQSFRPAISEDDDRAVRQKWNLPPDAPLLLHVGRLDSEKRVECVIQAAAKTLGQTDAHLVIVGDGTRKFDLIDLCKSLGIADRVHFTGYISTEQGLLEIYRAATLFITASEIETQGIVLLEAAASGLPIVAVDATCIPEIVHDGINGILADPGDVRGLGDAVRLLVCDKQKAVSMGESARRLAARHETRFSIEAHETLYQQMLQLQCRAGREQAGAPICLQ